MVKIIAKTGSITKEIMEFKKCKLQRKLVKNKLDSWQQIDETRSAVVSSPFFYIL